MISLFKDDDHWSKYKEVLYSWEGTPYRHLWRAKNRGVDCTLYLAAVLLEYGILRKVKHDYYPRDWHIHTREEIVMEGFFNHLINYMIPPYTIKWIDKSTKLERGDIVAFATTKMGVTNHCGIVVDKPKLTMINSINRRGVSEMRLGNWWMKRLRNVFRVTKEQSWQ